MNIKLNNRWFMIHGPAKGGPRSGPCSPSTCRIHRNCWYPGKGSWVAKQARQWNSSVSKLKSVGTHVFWNSFPIHCCIIFLHNLVYAPFFFLFFNFIFKDKVILPMLSSPRLRHKLLAVMIQTWWSVLYNSQHSKHIVWGIGWNHSYLMRWSIMMSYN